MANILIVEDEQALTNLLAEIFSTHQLAIARDGEEGHEKSRESRPDLIILDIGLPTLDGLTLCDLLKSDPELKHVPVLILTGRGRIQDIEDAFSRGADDYIVKLFSLRILEGRVEALLSPSPVLAATS